MTYIKTFDQINKNDVLDVGGKGASLGEMTKAGIPVPQGFVITTEAKGQINEGEILKAYDDLNTEKVSVRSSAVAEDSAQASWAGQLETYLNITKENLIDKVKDCWNSIKSERARSYAARQNLPEDQLLIAVVIQKMVDSKTSGVMFTVNPVTKDKNEIMIEFVLGLGESLVQGLVTPDNFIVDKKSLEIRSKDLQQKGKQALSDEKIKELVKFGKTIEEHYGSPQDIEWAIDDQGKIWILQSRPITTL